MTHISIKQLIIQKQQWLATQGIVGEHANAYINEYTTELVSQTITDLINLNNGEFETEIVNGMFNAILDNHRTLQAGFITILYKVIKQYGGINEKVLCDGRNILAKKMCQQMIELYENTHC